jgi:hypothetical protein
MNYGDVFDNLSVGDLKPEPMEGRPSNQPSSEAPRAVSLSRQPVGEQVVELNPKGTVAGRDSEAVIDHRDHFPVLTATQAQSSLSRAMQLQEVPAWYNGSLDELRQEVYLGATATHPGTEFKVSVLAADVVALSDGQETSETQKGDLINPEDGVQKKVPQKPRPSIASHLIDTEEKRRTIAGDLMEMLKAKEDAIKAAKKVATRLMKDGLTGEEFAGMISFLQEDVLHELLMKGATAENADRRQALLDRLTAKKDDKKKKAKDEEKKGY